MGSIQIFGPHGEIQYDGWTFPGGEPHIRLKRIAIGPFRVVARIRKSEDLILLAMINDALRRANPHAGRRLFLPYFPGARGDRFAHGEPLPVVVYGKFINDMGFTQVTVVDPHSDALSLVVENLHAKHVDSLIGDFLKIEPTAGLIAPDLGARRRVDRVAARFGLPVVQATKHRDPKTGKLSGFACDPLPTGGRWIVVDDICDGGGTFLGLRPIIGRVTDAAAWGQPYSVDLWVTHGIFSKGLQELKKRFGRIATTDSYYAPERATFDGILPDLVVALNP